MLDISELHAEAEGKEILSGINLSVRAGETIALMGPNGSGKSTLAAVLAGHPGYTVTSGSVRFQGEELLTAEPEERACRGLFLAFQYPAAIPGVSVSQFLRLALNAQEKARGEEPTRVAAFLKELRIRMKELGIPLKFAERSVNDGFSGGEKKRLEMLQMLLLRPRLAILDEIDSGLDIDAIKVVAGAVRLLPPETAVLAITHYQRLLEYLNPDAVYVLKAGRIVESGDASLALRLEQTGYGELI